MGGEKLPPYLTWVLARVGAQGPHHHCTSGAVFLKAGERRHLRRGVGAEEGAHTLWTTSLLPRRPRARALSFVPPLPFQEGGWEIVRAW